MEKSPIFLGAVGNVDGQTGVSLALDSEHTRQRKALGYLFTSTALLQEEHLLHVHIQNLMGFLHDCAAEKKAVDLSSWCEFFRLEEIMGIRTHTYFQILTPHST